MLRLVHCLALLSIIQKSCQDKLPPRIDTHAHFMPDFLRQMMQETGNGMPDGLPAIPAWSVEDHLTMMDTIGIAKSILSISTPGTHLVPGDDALAANVTRRVNTFAADLKRTYPEKFGFFASLPLPAVNETLEEIEVAFREGADGVLMLTNFHGHYLGDAIFEPVMTSLNEKGAVAMIHPTTPKIIQTDHTTGNQQVINAVPLMSHPRYVYEFFVDTTRAVINLFLSGVMSRYPNITWIIPHAGGAFSPSFARFVFSTQALDLGIVLTEEELRTSLLKQCFFDLAGNVFPNSTGTKGQIAGLVDGLGIPPQNLLVGTDYCYTSASSAEILQGNLDTYIRDWFDNEGIEAVYHGNAERILSKSTSP